MVCRCLSPSKTQASIWTLFPNKDNPGSAIAQARLPRPRTASEPTTPALSPSKLMPPSGHYSPAKTTQARPLRKPVCHPVGLNQQCLHPQKYYPRPCRAICRSFGWAVSQTRPPDSRPHEVHSFRHPNYESPLKSRRIPHVVLYASPLYDDAGPTVMLGYPLARLC